MVPAVVKKADENLQAAKAEGNEGSLVWVLLAYTIALGLSRLVQCSKLQLFNTLIAPVLFNYFIYCYSSVCCSHQSWALSSLTDTCSTFCVDCTIVQCCNLWLFDCCLVFVYFFLLQPATSWLNHVDWGSMRWTGIVDQLSAWVQARKASEYSTCKRHLSNCYRLSAGLATVAVDTEQGWTRGRHILLVVLWCLLWLIFLFLF